MGILVPWPGIEPMTSALQGAFLTTGPPTKSPEPLFYDPQAEGHQPNYYASLSPHLLQMGKIALSTLRKLWWRSNETHTQSSWWKGTFEVEASACKCCFAMGVQDPSFLMGQRRPTGMKFCPGSKMRWCSLTCFLEPSPWSKADRPGHHLHRASLAFRSMTHKIVDLSWQRTFTSMVITA